jgi:hypothetical protein
MTRRTFTVGDTRDDLAHLDVLLSILPFMDEQDFPIRAFRTAQARRALSPSRITLGFGQKYCPGLASLVEFSHKPSQTMSTGSFFTPK